MDTIMKKPNMPKVALNSAKKATSKGLQDRDFENIKAKATETVITNKNVIDVLKKLSKI